MQNSTGKFRVGIFLSALFCVFFSFGDASAAAGDLDFSFGVQGRQMVLIPNLTQPNAMDWDPTEDIAFQADGKILVAGSAWDNSRLMDFTVTRFNTDGTLDTSFAQNGVFRYDFFGDDHGYGIVVQPDGKIIIAGEAYLGVFNDQVDTAFGLIRLNPNGSFDSTFGNGGIVITNFFASLDAATEIALQPDGKIVATGYVTQGGVNTGSTYDFALTRYNPNGSLDATFGDGGKVTTDFNGNGDLAQTSVLQRDGKIVLAGWVRITNGSQYDFGLARYNADGSLDATFDGDGKVVTTFGSGLNELARGMSLAPDGKIVVAGDFYNPPPVVGQSGHWDVAAARYNTDGSLDNTFDGDGRFSYDSNMSDRNEGAQDVVVQPDGKILMVGDSRLIVNAVPGVSDQDLQIIRLNVNGSFDGSFGSGGIVLTDFGIFDPPGAPNYGSGRTAEVMLAAAIALQADGKIVAVNDSRRSTNSRRVAVSRYLNDITTNVVRRSSFDFDGDGRSDISVYRDGVWHLLQSTGGYASAQFGLPSDKLTPADFDGDGKTDIAVYRDGTWYILQSSNGQISVRQFGIAGDTPLPSDFDGDGRADFVVFRPTDNVWYRQSSSGNTISNKVFGLAGDKPVAGDFDGDGKSDAAIFRPSTGDWWWQSSIDNAQRATRWGISTDIPVAADYDGDNKTDFAVYRDGVWYVLQSRDGALITQFGVAADKPTPADYDGDGKADLAVYRDGTWHLLKSGSGYAAQQFGLAGDSPISFAFTQ
jgi:uncharacterized delta-60 repeat protein